MENIFYFAIVALIVVISISVILKILLKKFNPEKSQVRLYGILQGVTTKEIIAISASIVSYIFMLYLMVSFINVSVYIVIIVLFLTILRDILIKNKKIFIDIFLDVISLGGIWVIYLVHDYITNEYMDIWMLLLLVFVMIFVFLYLSYMLLRNLNSVVIANKYIRKGDKNEN